LGRGGGGFLPAGHNSGLVNVTDLKFGMEVVPISELKNVILLYKMS